jgi:hypothetical protein
MTRILILLALLSSFSAADRVRSRARRNASASSRESKS